MKRGTVRIIKKTRANVMKIHRTFRTGVENSSEKASCGECPFLVSEKGATVLMHKEGSTFRRMFCSVYHITNDPGEGWRMAGVVAPDPVEPKNDQKSTNMPQQASCGTCHKE